MAKLGQPLPPPPSDLIEVMTSGAPVESTVPFDESVDQDFAGGFDKWTSPEARRAGANRVTHTSITQVPLYNYLGEDRIVAIDDVPQLVDASLPAERRLHIRCPKCIRLPNGGLHPFAGPNGCPGKTSQKYMTCPICASRGFNKRVYESDEVIAAVPGMGTEDDPNYVSYKLPDASTREDVLQERLELHMTSFHAAEAQQLYGLRREPSGNGWRIVRGRE